MSIYQFHKEMRGKRTVQEVLASRRISQDQQTMILMILGQYRIRGRVNSGFCETKLDRDQVSMPKQLFLIEFKTQLAGRSFCLQLKSMRKILPHFRVLLYQRVKTIEYYPSLNIAQDPSQQFSLRWQHRDLVTSQILTATIRDLKHQVPMLIVWQIKILNNRRK